MVKLLQYFFIITISFTTFGCEDDAPMSCPNIDSLESEVKINGETLLLQMAEVRKNSTSELDTYEFLIDAVGSDCNQILKFRFYGSVPIDEPLEGSFTLIESIVFTAERITSFTYTVETIEPVNFDILYAMSGEAQITDHSNNEYTLAITAQLSNEEEVSLNLRHEF